MTNPFDFDSYLEFLQTALPTHGKNRGIRNRLAETLNCQKAFVSQVLGGKCHFSLEHGLVISKFLQLDKEEQEYFLLLLHKERAGSIELARFYEERLKELKQKKNLISSRIAAQQQSLGEADQLIYYSSWIYAAIHMGVMIPDLKDKVTLSRYFNLPVAKINEVLNFLASRGLVEIVHHQIKTGPTRLHLSSKSPLTSKHHANWRMRAIQALDRSENEENLHYSLVMSASREAMTEIRSVFLDCIKRIEPILSAAKDEEVFVLNLDIFGEGNR